MREQYVDLNGLYLPQSFGAVLAPSPQAPVPTGIASTLRFGAPQLLGGSRAYPAGLRSSLLFGSPRVAAVELGLEDGWPVERYAELPFYEAQRKLSEGLLAGSARVCMTGWHGAGFDPRRGSYALVSPDGPCIDLVGKRVRLRGESSEVFVLVVDKADVPDEMSVTRRVFLELGWLTDDTATVQVQEVSGQ